MAVFLHVTISNNNNEYIDRRIYINLSKSIQSTAGLKALKVAANGRSLRACRACVRVMCV